MAVGNVVGSNICNIALIVGLASVLQPLKIQARLVRLDVPILIGISLLSGRLLWNGRLGWQEGGLLLGLLGGYVVLNFRLSRQEAPEVMQEGAATLPHPLRHPLIEIAIVALGLGLLILGGHWFLEGAVHLARWLGLSEAFIGLSVVAVGTSLPELATSVVAALRREADIAVGNVVGSNLFNLLAILGLSAVVRPLQTTDVEHVDLLVMNALTWVLLPLMWSGYRIRRGEGLVLLGLYGAYLLVRAGL